MNAKKLKKLRALARKSGLPPGSAPLLPPSLRYKKLAKPIVGAGRTVEAALVCKPQTTASEGRREYKRAKKLYAQIAKK
jgi:hypothetical protein